MALGHHNQSLQISAFLFVIINILFFSCQPNQPSAPVPPKTFLNVTFDKNHTHFSTDGSMSDPVDSNAAKLISNKIDITFTYPTVMNADVGFFDPITRSQVWPWNDYYQPWLNNGVETRYYTTNLTPGKFDQASLDEKKIGEFFDNGACVLEAHPVFTYGSCIGGIQNGCSPCQPGVIYDDYVYGFKNTLSGKRGLMYVDYNYFSDQSIYPPNPSYSYSIVVDIIREN